MTATFRTAQPVSPIDANKPHVVFVGLPGAGKTSVGEGVAQALGRAFLDLDREIERREGMPVSQIFGERGEHHFRKLEAQLTGELREVGGMIVSPGGGWIAQPGNVELLRPPARIIYLRVRPETAIKRLGAERATRPLLVTGPARRAQEAVRDPPRGVRGRGRDHRHGASDRGAGHN